MRNVKLSFSSLLLCGACAGAQPAAGTGGNMMGDIDKMASDGAKQTNNMTDEAWAPVQLHAKNDSGVTGTVQMTPVADGVKFVVAIQGATPGKHGIHIHEKADCSSADGKSAGGHWNPKGVDHALPPADARHAGDLGNITVNEQGVGALDFTAKGLTLKSGELSVANHGLIIHAAADDGGQPTGNAGARIACAELKHAAKAEAKMAVDPTPTEAKPAVDPAPASQPAPAAGTN